MTDLILRGGRVIDPASGRDETADIAFGDGKVTEIGRDLPASGAEIIDMRGLLVVPGLIDLHTHVYWGGTSLGVEAVEVARQSGTTTFVDAGSAGPGTFHGFRRHVIELSPLRIIPYLNVSFPGIFAVSAAVTVGECADLRLLDPRECVRVIRANRDLIAGVKVRVGATPAAPQAWHPSTLRSRSQKRPGFQSWRISTTHPEPARSACAPAPGGRPDALLPPVS
jgi:dihydroorotase